MIRTLDGCTILIVEDEPLIGFGMADVIRTEGGEVIGPGVTCGQALRAMAGRRINAAILDIMLKGKMVFGLADALLGQRVPFVFVTGDVEHLVPERYKHVPIVLKPFVKHELISALKKAMRQKKFSGA